MRTVHMRVPILSTISLFALSVFVAGTVRGQPSCSVTPTLRIPATAQIFSIQQERTLGDIEADLVESNYHAAHDEEFAAHLNAIAARVLSQFPRDQAPVHVILIDAPEANSFTVGPERIYITRKMVALLRNDDELAGLLGHELGHVLTHQNSIIVTQLFHEILGVNAVSDRKDILEKLRRVLHSIDRDPKLLRKTAEIMEKQESMHQNEADRVALYASAAAGFSPQAYVELFERSEGTKGSSGSVLTDYFGATTSNLRRLREIQKTLRQLPRPCREIVPAASAEFRAWQAAVMSDPDLARR
jgi:predicted Zn-dependent protease